MKWFVIENTWLSREPLYEGHRGMDFGWGNGYVVIPPYHSQYGVGYEEIPVDVHGGLTFCGDAEKLDWPDVEGLKGWVVGFDTAHLDDTLVRWPKEEVEAETLRLRAQLVIMNKFKMLS